MIDIWASVAKADNGFDFAYSLPLYPCSLFLYMMPFVIWGNEKLKYMGCGYICTVGLFGGLINFLYPVTYLYDYSCISFQSFHTFLYHGIMIYAAFTILFTGMHSFKNVDKCSKVLLPFVPVLLMSIPANILNFSPIQSDYMYFMAQNPLVAKLFGGGSEIIMLLKGYGIYFTCSTIWYIPSFSKYIYSKWRLKRSISIS